MAINPLTERHFKITDRKKMACLDCAVILSREDNPTVLFFSAQKDSFLKKKIF